MQINLKQKELLNKLEKNFANFKPQKFYFFSKPKPINLGFYIYGNVGSGKTTVMKMFFDKANIKSKKFIHYQQLIKLVHKYNQKSAVKSDYITLFAREYFKNTSLLCIDEVELKDPADTVIIHTLLAALKNKTYVVFSSNFHPADFVKSILNIDLIMPLINMLLGSFNIYELGSEADYRVVNSGAVSERILLPANAVNRHKFLKNIADLIAKYPRSTAVLENFGRKIIFPSCYGPVLLSSFDELCAQELSYSDYIAICERFEVIIIDDIPLIQSNDIVTRFINLIDNVYFYKVLLFALINSDKLEDLYTKKLREIEFGRTVSRLTEINGSNYLLNSKAGHLFKQLVD